MSGVFMVRAVVADPADRAKFDQWYQDEHLPDALKAFGAKSAWRAWSEVDPSVHYAVYEFDSIEQVRAIPGSGELKALVAEFDRVWGKKVARVRDELRVAQRIAA
jgi:hypothetical protein